MSTAAPPLLTQLAKDWESKTGLKSAVCSGIIGDKAHEARGGYHIGRKFQPSSNYSVTRPDDRPGNGPDDVSAAIDMTMSTADMKTCTTRLMKLYTDSADPRRKYLNAFNGWTGSGGAQRWDVYARKVKGATADHKWHVHLEVRRKYVGSATAMAAILSAIKGESVATYLASTGVSTASKVVSSAVPKFPGVLKRNDKQAKPDAGVKAWQAQMIKRGWSSLGSADGYFGPKVQDVVRKWQARAGLTVTGVIDEKTWSLAWTRPIAS